MAEAEEYFPRGGKKPAVQYFKQSSNFLGAIEKGQKKKSKPKKKSETDDGYLSDESPFEVDQSFKSCAFGLGYKIVKPGVLILGRVRQVLETRVNLSLPCRMLGSVMACHISEPYNKLLEAYVNDQVEKVQELSTIFRPGQYVAVKVLEVDGEKLILTMMPQHVNGSKSHSELHKGCILQAAVSSVEDHGYVMDIGISNTRAFLPKGNANPEVELDIGVIAWCCVKSVAPSPEGSVVTLASELGALQQGVVKHKPTSALLPGTALDFTVDKPLENGIEGHVFRDTVAYVQRQHAAAGKQHRPALGQRVRGRVLYVMPTRNTPFLTLRDIFESSYPDLAAEQRHADGDIVDNAQVIKITGRSIHFKLGRGSVGVMSLKRIQVDEDLTDEDVVAKSYPIGSTHRVRVMCYNLSDYVYSVSDQPAVLAEKYFALDQLAVGQVVTGTVRTVAETNVTLTIGRLTGHVPHAHLSDAGVYIDPKKARKSNITRKFKVGQEVRARVLAVEPARQTLFLTLKPSLLEKDLELLQSYEHAEVGKSYTGVIKLVREYLLVSFFNHVTALVPRAHVSAEPLHSLADVFHLGQIVNCTILRVDAKAKKMTGSLIKAPFKRREQSNTDSVPSKKRKLGNDQTEAGSKNNRLDNATEVATKKDKTACKKDKTGRSQTEVASETDQTDLDQAEVGPKKDRKAKRQTVSVTSRKNIKEDIEEDDDGSDTEKNNKENSVEIKEQAVTDKKARKKKRDKKLDVSESDASETNIHENSEKHEVNDLTKKAHKRKTDKLKSLEHSDKGDANKNDLKTKKNKIPEVSEESDAIETDIQPMEDQETENGEQEDHVLTAQDLFLIDFSDCVTLKNCKRRVVSLIKAIKAKTVRLDRIDKKILAKEKKGLNAKNKLYHTAMHMDRLSTEIRLKKLMEALEVAQGRLKEMGGDEPKTDFKKKKKEKEVHGDNAVDNTAVAEEVRIEKKRKTKSRDMIVLENLEPALEVPSAKEFWSANADSLSKKAKEQDSSSSDEENQEQPKKKRKKLTAAEKASKAREAEERVRELERRAIGSESQPRSSEQFERALLAAPSCSQLWIAYMAFHLQATEMEKARAVGRKALSTMSFREEHERLNVWLALLNCEHRFGTKESQQKTLEDALQTNDTYSIHSKLLDILVETGKQQELKALVDLMLRKYRREARAYLACGGAAYRGGLVDKARQVMQKAMAALEKKDHVSILVQFALLERGAGARERAEALFEQVLAVYPQRVDVCSVYVDTLLKDGDVGAVRQVMDRMTSQKLPARKMKILYKKWIEVEEKLGDQAQVESIRHRAMEYIDKAKF